jgi:hypothetical protein
MRNFQELILPGQLISNANGVGIVAFSLGNPAWAEPLLFRFSVSVPSPTTSEPNTYNYRYKDAAGNIIFEAGNAGSVSSTGSDGTPPFTKVLQVVPAVKIPLPPGSVVEIYDANGNTSFTIGLLALLAY